MKALPRRIMTACAALASLAGEPTAAREEQEAPPPAPAYRVELTTACNGYDGRTCWVHARAGAIPGSSDRPPTVVMTLQKLLLSGSDVFYELNSMHTADLGRTWSPPAPQAPFKRRQEGTREITVCDFVPKWHAKAGVLLGIGQTVHYLDNRVVPNRPRRTAYAVYDPAARAWSPWKTLDMPDAEKFYSAGAGSVQRFDLDNGEILLPVYFKAEPGNCYSTTVLRCRFDGRELTYLEHGTELTLNIPRGFAEPSLARCGGRFFMTLRNDRCGYVTSGEDGLRFDKSVEWKFDDGQPLGNYNTQQHWVTHGDALFLVYTRKGADNDHVFRHRAPLFMAQVDTRRLCVVRATERILVPQRGARLGNFGVVEVSPGETWVTAAEWMQPSGCEKYGSDNSVFIARILWDR